MVVLIIQQKAVQVYNKIPNLGLSGDDIRFIECKLSTTKLPSIDIPSSMTDEEAKAKIELEVYRQQTIERIEREKKIHQLTPVIVRDISFFGGRVAGQKYDEAFRLAKMMGLTEGEFASTDGSLVVVDETFATEVITAVAGASYMAWKQATLLINQAKQATSIDELDAIVWA